MKTSEYKDFVSEYIVKKLDYKKIDEISKILAFTDKNVFLIGNGGSASNASHFAQDLLRGTYKCSSVLRNSENLDIKIKAISLVDNISTITSIANDDGYEYVFVNQLKAYASEGDILIAISGSGNSKNIIMAAEWAKRNSMFLISFTGFDGGKLAPISDINLTIDVNDMFLTEIFHSYVFHYIIKKIKELRENN